MYKRVVGVSIGSSRRDHKATVEWMGHIIEVERRGTNGDIQAAMALLRELDGKVDAFGMGGIDLYLIGDGGKQYTLRAALPLLKATQKTPIVDGSGIKNSLEYHVVSYLRKQSILDVSGKKCLVVCALDRNGMARGLHEGGAALVMGDMMFSLGIPIPIHRMKTLRRLADVLLPPLSQLPFSMLYPTGEKQHKSEPEKYRKYYEWADIIAGDYHFINRYMPQDMRGKTILTNTVTPADVAQMRLRGVELLITTTPDIDGRSFGTNVLQAMMVAVMGKRPEEIRDEEYQLLFDQLPCTHRVVRLQEQEVELRPSAAQAAYIG